MNLRTHPYSQELLDDLGYHLLVLTFHQFLTQLSEESDVDFAPWKKHIFVKVGDSNIHAFGILTCIHAFGIFETIAKIH